MYKISVLTLFPDSISWIKEYSIIKRAIQNNLLDLEIINFRDWSNDKHHKVDDTPYGGGPGMVIKLQPICDCLNSIKEKGSKIYLLSPIGQTYNQGFANAILNETKHLILICGHYEGVDNRIENYIDGYINIGDYILTGGEIPALSIIDSLTRLLDNAINKLSLENESFNNNLLDYPVYTKPLIYDNHTVPEILISGNHKLIDKWRYEQQIKLTKKNRPDLYKKYLKFRKD